MEPMSIFCQYNWKKVWVDSQSMEQRPPTSPKVLLYPTRKLKGFRVVGDAKKCVHQYKPPEVGIAEPRSACCA